MLFAYLPSCKVNTRRTKAFNCPHCLLVSAATSSFFFFFLRLLLPLPVPHHITVMQQLQQQQKLQSIFDVAAQIDSLSGSNAAAFKRIFRVTSAQAQCNVGPQLAAKYKVQEDNEQHVVSVTNMYTLEQTWYNQARTTKPQTFANSTAAIDPTNNGQNCDLCACKPQNALLSADYAVHVSVCTWQPSCVGPLPLTAH